eukprot:TRINITY_DN55384_c0_g1_i1.p1 TRINITY_DN55384_c0_g1~~TRINITY_DN55384_c0_g1_i1.p1  ORF type:complete len:568 (-),score=100.30 TRINITY_DN55384_c0_g1_i1:87-1790(-)
MAPVSAAVDSAPLESCASGALTNMDWNHCENHTVASRADVVTTSRATDFWDRDDDPSAVANGADAGLTYLIASVESDKTVNEDQHCTADVDAESTSHLAEPVGDAADEEQLVPCSFSYYSSAAFPAMTMRAQILDGVDISVGEAADQSAATDGVVDDESASGVACTCAADCVCGSIADESAVEEVRDEVKEAECRICQSTVDMKDLISPCRCTGSMKYVHPECLTLWRRRSPESATVCGVCKTRYSNVFVPALGSAVFVYVQRCSVSLCRGCPRESVRNALEQILTGNAAAFCFVRLILWILLLFQAVILGRILLLLATAIHEVLLGFDRSFNPLLLSPESLAFYDKTFPAMSGAGYLGLADVVQASFDRAFVKVANWSDINITNITNVTAGIGTSGAPEDGWQVLTALCMRLMDCWCLPETISDLVLGTFVLLLVSHAVLRGGGDFYERPVPQLLDVPSPFTDARVLLDDEFIREPMLLVPFLLILIPSRMYVARWMLGNALVLPMDEAPVHENLVMHLLLAFGLTGLRNIAEALIESVVEDFSQWYASYTLVGGETEPEPFGSGS